MLQPTSPILIATAFLTAAMAQDARFELLAPSNQFPQEPSNLVMWDLDGDGDTDLVHLPRYNANGGGDPHAYWLENLGKRRFAPLKLCHVAPAGTDEWLERPTFADLSGDVAAEIFVSRRGDTTQNIHEPLALTPVLNGPAPADGRVLAPAGPWPWTALDLDGDGPAELIHFSAPDGSPVTLHVLERQGDGSFAEVVAQPLTGPTGISPWSEIKALDLDSDGDLDLSFLNDSTGIQTLERTGPRGFAASVQMPSPRWGDRWIDIDGDGRLDLLLADGGWMQNLGGLAFEERPDLMAWQIVRSGWFYTAVSRPGEIALFHAVIAGPDDTLVFTTYQADSEVPVFEQVLPVSLADYYPWFFGFEDLDGDGYRDLLFRSQQSSGSTAIEVLWGSSKRFKKPARIFSAPPRFQPVFTGDFDEDGLTDLILGPDADGKTWLRRNRGLQGLGLPEPLNTLKLPRHSLEIVQTGDADGDGHLDLICRSIARKATGDEAVLAVARGRGNGRFGLPIRPPVQPSGAASGGEWVDWDLDGDPDLVGFGYLQENTRGKFRTTPRHLIDLGTSTDFLGNPATIGFTRTGDLDGDGAPDIVSAIYGEAVPPTNGGFPVAIPSRAGIGFNDGSGRLAGPIAELPTTLAGIDFLGNPSVPGDLSLADLDLDGDLDICLREITGSDFLGNPLETSRWLENPGRGSRDPASWTSAPLPGEVLPSAPRADFDGDGSPEWVNPNGYLKASVGGPVAADGFHFTGDADLSQMGFRAAADLNGDGMADFILGGNVDPLLLVYRPQ